MKTLSICGAGHSGSTLLGLILGSHSACFYAGECAKVRYLGDAAKPERKRVCKLCGPRCEIWSGFEWDRRRPLYEQIAERVGAAASSGGPRLVVDSTKNVRWIRRRTAETESAGGRPHLLFLTRDGRAVINSRLRKYPERDAETQIRAWMEQIELSERLFGEFPGRRLRLRYEDLATRPEEVVPDLCRFLGLPYEPEMLRFQASEHHPLGGNNGTQYQVAKARLGDPQRAFVSLGERSRRYYERHDAGIHIDLRWKDELSPAHFALFERVAGSFNESMEWEV